MGQSISWPFCRETWVLPDDITTNMNKKSIEKSVDSCYSFYNGELLQWATTGSFSDEENPSP